MQEGYLALWRSCLRFREDLGYHFSTYAGAAIRYAMSDFLRKEHSESEKIVSVYEVIADNGEGEELHLIDTLSVPPEDGYVDNLLEYCMKQLKKSDQKIIKSLLNDHTQQETAVLCLTSQASVSRCLAKFRKIVTEELKK